MQPSPIKKRTRGKYSYGGCGICRKRHVKCDQVRPTCLTCRAIGATCDGYKTELKWINNVTDGKAQLQESSEPRARKPVYTEQLQLSTSQALQSQVSSQGVDRDISILDDKSREGTIKQDNGLSIGPFAVFSSSTQAVDVPRGKEKEIPVDPGRAPVTPLQDELLNQEPINLFTSPDNLLSWSDLFDLDFPIQLPSLLQPPHLLDGFSIPVAAPPVDEASNSISVFPSSMQGIEIQNDVADKSLTSTDNATSQAFSGVQSTDIKPEEAQMLLKHYRHHTVPNLWSMPLGQKVPLQTHMDCALTTLAKLTFMDQPVSHAAQANLIAILGVAAKHIAAYSYSDDQETYAYWQEYAEQKFKEAKHHWDYSLRHELKPKGAKYKEHLMAVSALISYAIIYDRQTDLRVFIVDAEKLLLTSGMAKRKVSRKVRFLHHTYTWNRIVGESTFVLRRYESSHIRLVIRQLSASYKKNHAAQNSNAHGSSGWASGTQNPKLDDFLRFEPESPSRYGESPNQPACAEELLHDIHLEEPQGRSESIFMLLYGISETWLSLLSHTTRLANVMEALQSSKETPDFEVFEALEKRKGDLENMVCSFAASNGTMDASARQAATARSNMVRALNDALLIFFYRRIRNVHPFILQKHVNSVIESLKDFEASCEREGIDGPGSPWPAFMAGCEAMSQGQREYLGTWFDKAFVKTAFTRLETAKACMTEVWKRRDRTGQHFNPGRHQVWSWVQESKERDLYILLS